jgi:hypothetical protein
MGVLNADLSAVYAFMAPSIIKAYGYSRKNI